MLRWLILTVSILITSYLIEGIIVSGFFTAIFAAAVLGILNAFLRPIALILTLPINILSLGLFTFVINAIMLKMASSIIPGFSVNGFWAAVLGAFLVSIISWVLNSFVNEKGNVQYIELKHKGGNRWE